MSGARLISASKTGGVTFSVDISGFLDAASRLTNLPKEAALAQRRALGTLFRRLKTEARRDIQKEYNLKANAINLRLSVSRALDGIYLRGSSAGIGLIDFAARQNNKGVSYSIKKGQRRLLAHAFIRSPRGQNRRVVWLRGDYVKTSRTSVYANDNRHGYPIYPQFGPSVAQMLKHGNRPQRLVDFAARIINSEIDRLLAST
ncbi:MAG TPA: hypothetical protein VF216_12205 [Mizugakiibacter sp.]